MQQIVYADRDAERGSGARSPRRTLPAIDQVIALAEAVGSEYQAMVWLGSVLGLRFSEVIGLRVGRLNLLDRSLDVAETVTRDSRGRPVHGPPKSDASRRTIAIPDHLVNLLADHLHRKGLNASNADALVFTAPDGGAIRYANWRNRVWLPACKSVGLTSVGFHDLRRLSATLLVLDKVDPKTAQSRLGHSDVRLTLGLYAQAVAEADRSAADLLGNRFFPAFADRGADGAGQERTAPEESQGSSCGFRSGGERTRTADFHVANVALYQLSYTPGAEKRAAGIASRLVPRLASSERTRNRPDENRCYALCSSTSRRTHGTRGTSRSSTSPVSPYCRVTQSSGTRSLPSARWRRGNDAWADANRESNTTYAVSDAASTIEIVQKALNPGTAPRMREITNAPPNAERTLLLLRCRSEMVAHGEWRRTFSLACGSTPRIAGSVTSSFPTLDR